MKYRPSPFKRIWHGMAGSAPINNVPVEEIMEILRNNNEWIDSAGCSASRWKNRFIHLGFSGDCDRAVQ